MSDAAAAAAPARRVWTPLAVPDLAAAAEGVILFDGVCVFCSRWVAFVLARDAAGAFRFATVQSRFGRALAARLGIDAEAPETNAVVLGGRAFCKSDAAIEVLRRLPGWGWVSVLRLVPRAARPGVRPRGAQPLRLVRADGALLGPDPGAGAAHRAGRAGGGRLKRVPPTIRSPVRPARRRADRGTCRVLALVRSASGPLA
jgi:predicted DCC family thiol-disulfide oxidoreductase YuxK